MRNVKMNNITCKKCGTVIINNSNKCPLCGSLMYSKNNTLLIVIVVFIILIIFALSYDNSSSKHSNSQNKYPDVWSYTMQYGGENLGFSIEGQVNALVKLMRLQGYTCYISNQMVRSMNNKVYNVSLSIICPDTNENLKYEWITDMNNKTVVPNNYYSRDFIYP